jgi:hypothetical protein
MESVSNLLYHGHAAKLWYGQLTAYSYHLTIPNSFRAHVYLISSIMYIKSSKSSLTPVSTRRSPTSIILRGLMVMLLVMLVSLIIPLPLGSTGFHHTVEEEDHRSFVVGRTLGSGSDRNHLGTVEEEGLGRSCIAAEEGRCRSCTPGEGVGSAAEERYNPDLRIGRWGPCLARRSVLLIQILVATAMSQLWIVEREKRAYHLAAHEILGRVQDTGSGLNVSSVFQVPIWNHVKSQLRVTLRHLDLKDKFVSPSVRWRVK